MSELTQTEIEVVEAALAQLKLNHERSQLEPDLIRFDIKVDESEDLEVAGMLFRTEDGVYFRLMGYVDEMDDANAIEQLKMLLALNGELPMGCYCMDPEEEIIYATVNLPLDNVQPEMLSWCIEFIFAAQEIYDQEMDPVENGNGDLAQG
jgi:hypothetical protein